MAGWNKILKEIQDEEIQSPLDTIRKKYIKQLYRLTERNIICYYSGFLTCVDSPDVAINDRDLNGFMTMIHGMDKAKELGLNIIALEDDEALQDAILSVHHCYMHTFQNTQAVKIIENQEGTSFIMVNVKSQR